MFHALVGRDLLRLDRETRRGTVALALLGLLAALAGIGIEGAALTDTGGAGILHGNTWRLGESTSLGLSLTVAAVALTLLILALESVRGWLAVLALPAGLVALGSLALTGHALTAGPLWLTAPVLAIHVLMAAFWLGALWPLWQAVGRRRPEAALDLLRRFSAIAIPAVALLVAAGATLAVLQLGRIGELLTTAYGIRLLSKLAFVVLLLLLAALNRFWLTPALAAGRTHATHRLRASIGLEIGLGIAILAATSSLGEVPPPRALIAAAMAHDMTAGAAMPGFSVVTFAGDAGGGDRGHAGGARAEFHHPSSVRCGGEAADAAGGDDRDLPARGWRRAHQPSPDRDGTGPLSLGRRATAFSRRLEFPAPRPHLRFRGDPFRYPHPHPLMRQ